MGADRLDERMPVLVGCGQAVQKVKDPTKAKSPIDLMAEVAERAAEDTGLGKRLWGAVDNVTTVRFITDSPDAKGFPFGVYPNAPQSLANALDIRPRTTYYGPTGGNTPQLLINHTAELIQRGESDVALIAGS